MVHRVHDMLMHVLHIYGGHIDCTAYLTRLMYMIITVFHMEPWRRHLNVLQSYHFQTKVYSCNLMTKFYRVMMQ
jgi:hypothetical protein